MLALVSAVRDMNIERRLQAERKLIIHSFAIDHQNYARYGAYQHVYLQSLKQQNHPAFVDMQIKGFSLTKKPKVTMDRLALDLVPTLRQ